MKISEIDIERFGVWRNLSLPLAGSGLNVLYGPNEAGKTTLMRFIQSVLYGFDPFPADKLRAAACDQPSAGSLHVRHDGQEHLLHRVSSRGSRGAVSISGTHQGESPDQRISQLLGETEERLFERIFAVGIEEMQKLATLHDSEVAGHIYGVSLGPEGQKLLDASHEVESELRRLFDIEDTNGELIDLLLRYEELLHEAETAKADRQRYRELHRDCLRMQSAIADLKERQNGIHEQLRGHQFLDRVWTPWKQVRQYRQQLAELPVITGFPENGIERLDELDDQISQLKTDRNELLEGSRSLAATAEALGVDRELQKHTHAMRGMVDEREWIAGVQQKCESLEPHRIQQEQSLDILLADLGENWSRERLESLNTSPQAHRRLAQTARTYQAALWQRGHLRRRYRRVRRDCQHRQAELDDNLKSLGNQSLDNAVQSARNQLHGLEDLSELRIRERELHQHRVSLDDQLVVLDGRFALPRWMAWVLVFFAVGGLAAAVSGFVSGAFGNGVAGIMWALMGTTCGLLAWALKTHFENIADESVQRLRDEARATEVLLRETRQEIDRLAPSLGNERSDDPYHNMTNTAELPTEPELIKHSVHRLSVLEGWSHTAGQLQKRRRRLSEGRGRLRQRQREVSTARQNWCQALVELGLTETVRIEEGMEEWQRALAAAEAAKTCAQTREELRIHREVFEAFRQRVEQLGRRIDRWDVDYAAPITVLDRWEEELRRLAENRAEFVRLHREAKSLKRKAAALRPTIAELNTRRSALLVQGGASTRDEFETRSRQLVEHRELDELLELAVAELDAAAGTEPELAIVEEDLLRYKPEENRECIDVLGLESEELESELQQTFEKLGRVRQMVSEIETEQQSTNIRFEVAQVEEQIKRAAEEWTGLQLAARCIDEMKRRYERNCQPETLAAASEYLGQLTAGKYANVWTPLGDRHLCVDDEHGRPLRVEQLSRGTREQLFLAIRLALVGQFAARGVELPMVLDDVIVNFDQLRTEAAVQTLQTFAEKHQQQILLFTCHLHLAHMFEAKGIDPIWLPGHNPPIEERAAG